MLTRVFDLYDEDDGQEKRAARPVAVPYGFDTMADLMRHGADNGLRIAAMMRANERVYEDEASLNAKLDRIRLAALESRDEPGIVSMVLRHYVRDCRPANAAAGARDFLLAAAAIGMVCKRSAAFPNDEIVACAMAAAGLTAALGGNNERIEAAAANGVDACVSLRGDRAGSALKGGAEEYGVIAALAIAASSAALNAEFSAELSTQNTTPRAGLDQTIASIGVEQGKYRGNPPGGAAVRGAAIGYALG